MQSKKWIAYGMLAVGGWVALVVAIHFIEKAGVDLASPVGLLRAGGWFATLAAFALYFVPGIVASRRCAKNTTGIVLLNVLLGWTVIGWIAALIWAFSGETTVEANSKQIDYQRLAATLRSPAPPPPPRA